MKGQKVVRENQEIDSSGQGFLHDFETLSSFGRTSGGGVDRQAGTAADRKQRRWFHVWLTERGFDVHYDRIGNQFGLLTFDDSAPYVLSGSHLDSQPLAGRFDGAYGVLASAHAAHRVAQSLGDAKPWRNLAVVNWFNEEGCRFKPNMLGSGVHTGKVALGTALDTSDRDGITVSKALEFIDGAGDFDGVDTYAYAEIHIEQGRILENAKKTIGLVTSTWAAQKFQLVVRGDQAHTGGAAMEDRRDALLGASLLVVAARELAEESDSTLPLRTSVSEMEILPNSSVTIAREVRLNLDLRSPDEPTTEAAAQKLKDRFSEIESRSQTTIEIVNQWGWGNNAYQNAGVELSRSVVETLGLSHQEIQTVAGHDSTNMKDVVPTVMLFVPSKDGVSHNEAEFTEDADMCAGVDVLSEVLRRLALGENIHRSVPQTHPG